MIGSDLTRFLRKDFLISPVNKMNYKTIVGKYFDIVINVNGNSKRYWANQNPLADFNQSTISVYKTIFDFPCSVYIYISSSDVYNDHTNPKNTKEYGEIDIKKLQPYGFHKYLSELIVKRCSKKFIILRLSMVLGSKLKKGPFFDIIHHVPLFVNLRTRLQLITTAALAEIIETILKKKTVNETINVGGIGTFDFKKIYKYFDREIQISKNAEIQIYEMNVKKVKNVYSKLKTSEDYLQEFISDIKM